MMSKTELERLYDLTELILCECHGLSVDSVDVQVVAAAATLHDYAAGALADLKDDVTRG